LVDENFSNAVVWKRFKDEFGTQGPSDKQVKGRASNCRRKKKKRAAAVTTMSSTPSTKTPDPVQFG
ncbi:MAG: hypothetical protein AAF078_11995, partial [Planctomycetota bacterium]